MTPTDFIRKHITAALVAEGFPESVAGGGAEYGLDHYRCMSQASKKGAAFDDCLYRARVGRRGRQANQSVKRARKSRDELPLNPACFDLLEINRE